MVFIEFQHYLWFCNSKFNGKYNNVTKMADTLYAGWMTIGYQKGFMCSENCIGAAT